MSKTVTIIDTFGFFFRSFYALPPLSNKKGFPTGLLTGFTNFISTLQKDHTSDYLIFALDTKGDTFRNEIDSNYKANRTPPPEELSMQLPIAIEWIEKMGFFSVSQSGYEADDMIASVTRSAVAMGYNVNVISHDKDLYQLIDDGKVVLVDAVKRKKISAKECFDKYGVHPHQFTDYQALIGDSADNVPGVKGVGKVTAEKLLKEFTTLDSIYENIDDVKPPRVQNLLIKHKEDAIRSRKLVTLEQNLFETFDFEKYKMHFENPFVKIYDELIEYEMNGILRQLNAKGMSNSNTAKPAMKSADDYIQESNRLEFTSNLVVDEETLFKLVDSLHVDTVVAFDTETTGLDYKTDSLVGFSFAFDEKNAYYVPLTHSYLGAPEQITLEAAKKAILKLLTCKIVGHNIKFDLHFLAKFLECNEFTIYSDTLILAWLDNSARKLSLDVLSTDYLNHDMVSFKDTVKKGETFANVAVEDACDYAAEDALITYKLYLYLIEKFKTKGVEHILAINETLETPFITTIMRMEQKGIHLDKVYMSSFKEEMKIEIDAIKQDVYSLCDTEFNLNSPKQLGPVLFETLELTPFKKTKTGYSTDEKALNAILGKHPVVEKILHYREVFKLYSTYIEPLLELAELNSESKIYTSFVQSGTATGRLSSKNPNLQNIPTKSQLGLRVRRAFVAGEGKVFIGIDYSQIELRLLAHFSQDTVLVDAFKSDGDIHTQTAIVLFGEEEASSKRNIAKTVNFGLLYGMGPKKLSETLDISLKESKEIIVKYFESFPTVKEYFKSIVTSSQELGYVETLLKRRRYFDYASASGMLKASYEREAVNTVFQGSAADLIKLSMVEIDKVIRDENLKADMLLQIHDELIFEVDEKEAECLASRFKEIMENITTLSIPLKTSVNIATSWADLK